MPERSLNRTGDAPRAIQGAIRWGCVVNLIKVSPESEIGSAPDYDQSQTFCYCSHIGEVGTRVSRRSGTVWMLGDIAAPSPLGLRVSGTGESIQPVLKSLCCVNQRQWGLNGNINQNVFRFYENMSL